jgi:hypothetical protein
MTKMPTLVENLRALSRYEHADASIGAEAADEIDRLALIEIKYHNLCHVLNEQAAEIERLQRALAFWLPGVPSSGSGRATRCGNDAMLLVGYPKGMELEPGAEDLGWITFRYADIP